MGIAIQAKMAKNSKERARLYQQGENKFNEKSAQFNAIIDNVRSELESKGFSTDIVNEYQDEFNKEVQLGQSLLQNLAK